MGFFSQLWGGIASNKISQTELPFDSLESAMKDLESLNASIAHRKEQEILPILPSDDNNILDTEWHWLPLRKKINNVFDFLKINGIIKSRYARYDTFKDCINEKNVIENESEFNEAIIQMLGSSSYDPQGELKPLSEQVWTFDFERDESVEYGDFIHRLNKMTGYILDFQEVKTIYHEIEKMGCGVEFKYKSKDFRWDFVYNNDWTDFNFFHKFLELVENDLDKKFYSSYFSSMSILYISDKSATEITEHLKIHLRLMT